MKSGEDGFERASRMKRLKAMVERSMHRELVGEDKCRLIDSFVRGGAFDDFPKNERDIHDENWVDPMPDRTGGYEELLVAHLERACELYGSAKQLPEPRWLAGKILNSSDPELLKNVREMRMSELSVERLLGHVESLRLGFSPRLAVSIARRAMLVLLGRSR